MSAIQPFQFEPERHASEEDNTENIQEEHEDVVDEQRHEVRVGQNSWCQCGNCISMTTERESMCYQELQFLSAAVQVKHTEMMLTSLIIVEDIPCITAHDNFGTVCLNRDVLWAALVSLHDRESAGLPNRNRVTNRSCRCAAYHQFTWWMHGWLGKRICRVIPSCAVAKIRNVYPEPSGIYTGFQEVDIDKIETDESWRDFHNL
ncbi:hypothetical protein ABVT39_018700 [Epinephelus coioides]